MSALGLMERARRAYRGARAAGRSPHGAHTAAMNAVRFDVGVGAWDIATKVQRESGD
jgi:hypothetical protein